MISKFVRGLIRPFLSAPCHRLSSYTSHIHSAKIVSVKDSANSVHYLKDANCVQFFQIVQIVCNSAHRSDIACGEACKPIGSSTSI